MGSFKITKMIMYLDFSGVKSSGVNLAIAISKRHNAMLTFFVKTNRNKFENSLLNLMHEANISFEGKIQESKPVDSICKVAHEEGYDLMVIITHGGLGLREYFFGSKGFRTVRNSPCPVLIIPDNWERTEFKKIVYPIWGLRGAFDKYDYAREMIEKDASNILIVGLAENENPHSVVDLINLVDKLELLLHNEHVEYSSVLYHTKKFHEKVIENAEEYDADLIVISGNLAENQEDLFASPFTKQIMNQSKRPILFIPTSTMDINHNTFDSLKNVGELLYK